MKNIQSFFFNYTEYVSDMKYFFYSKLQMSVRVENLAAKKKEINN